MSLLNYMIENEQKPKRIWLFGAILFGYLAFYSVQLLESSLCVFLKNNTNISCISEKLYIFAA